MDKAILVRGAVSPAGAPLLSSAVPKPVIPLRPDVKTVYDQLTDKSFDNLDRLQRYFYALKQGNLFPALDQFGGHFTNKADSIRNLIGGFTPTDYAMGWTAEGGFVSTGPIPVTVTTTLGSKTFNVTGIDPNKPMQLNMGIEATGFIPSGSYIKSTPVGGGDGVYTFDNADGLAATASGTASGYFGNFMLFYTPDASTKYSLNSCHIAFDLVSGANSASTSDPFIGRMPKSGITIDNLRLRIGAGGNDLFRINAPAGSKVITVDLPPTGHYIFNRVSNTRVEIWHDGAFVIAYDDVPASALPSMIAWARSSAVFQNIGWKTSSHGAGLTANQCAALYRAHKAV